jgi:hypothetical protein
MWREVCGGIDVDDEEDVVPEVLILWCRGV